MNDLVLHLKREFFDAIVAGTKTEEYRACTEYWKSQLIGKHYAGIQLHCGYPATRDSHRIIRRAWNGWRTRTISHPHFGDSPATVFAIDVSKAI